MSAQAVIVGMGQLGRTLGEGLLLNGITVTPVLRSTAIDTALNPQTVILATGEDDLGPALKKVPQNWKERSVVLLQNELLPPQWKEHGISEPTVFVVWFERKQGKPITPLLPSRVYGPQQDVIRSAMDSLAIPCEVTRDETEILTELMIKNAYIWATNIASLEVGRMTTGELYQQHSALVEALVQESVAVQNAVMGESFPVGEVLERVNQALLADTSHNAGGRSAKRRLERFLVQAHKMGVAVPQAQSIAQHNEIVPRS
ncbi:MAG: hypothetical protein M1294_10230 [Firmicutes bacterium]|jgi:hypothetical protein|uniref:Ketopantoate reductase n=1 Tax=Sulfobacillus benefaciens TaxID=453960 RepID=A0A2T2X747_9FIRM|nr:hypothetical protein [Bacillota bacterium]MCL5012669.1 hypothetical protein [Bacillota bacterium]PSR30309.1 MAG: hypothetical protein C7B43_06220 [Sulfobacillus benefaciens]